MEEKGEEEVESIKANFDDFTFHSRVMPSLLVILPIIFVGVYEGIIKEGVLEILCTLV